MWTHYRRTFVRMQIVIWLVSLIALWGTHQIAGVLLMFVVLQVSAVIGAVWAARISALTRSRRSAAPASKQL